METSIISLAIAVTGMLSSLTLFKRRRDITKRLRSAKIIPPPQDHTIQNILQNRDNEERLNVFYDAKKYLKLVLGFVWILGLFIIVLLGGFYLNIQTRDARQLAPDALNSSEATRTLTLKLGPKIDRTVELSTQGISMFQVDHIGNIYTIPLSHKSNTEYLSVSKTGEVSVAYIDELVLTIVIFSFLFLLILGFFLINKMEDCADRVVPEDT